MQPQMFTYLQVQTDLQWGHLVVQVTGILKRGLSYGHYKLSFAFNQDDRLLLPSHQRSQNNCPMLPLFGVLH